MAAILGIDVAESKFDIALLRNGKFKSKSFENKQSGFESLVVWLKQHDVVALHACLEATGSYGDALARFLFEVGHIVSVVTFLRNSSSVRYSGFSIPPS